MQKMIEDILVYSQTNFKERKVESVDLNILVQEVLTELKEDIKKKNAVINFTTLPILPLIRSQFRQLFINLISNSLKFAKKDVAPYIYIESKMINPHKIKELKTAKNGNYCQLSISDNGIGFDQKYNTRIFELFQRLHDNKEYSGTGLGLALCKKIVENHQGVITSEGNPGGGSKFIIFLPVYELPQTQLSDSVLKHDITA